MKERRKRIRERYAEVLPKCKFEITAKKKVAKEFGLEVDSVRHILNSSKYTNKRYSD